MKQEKAPGGNPVGNPGIGGAAAGGVGVFASGAGDSLRHGLLRFAPAGARPWLLLMRADRPAGAFLLLLPCWQGLALAMASSGVARWQDAVLGLLFFIGAFAMRGAGCVLNDIVDRDIDARVARTRDRPLPSGQVSLGRATLFGLALCLLAGAAILPAFNPGAILWSLAAVVPACLYPFMKRVTHWPQLFLGIAFNWGIFIGWVAHSGDPVPASAALALYGGNIAWTIGYDTIYALQDRQDDRKLGVRSTALLFGNRARLCVGVFYLLALMGASLAGLLAGLMNPVFCIALVCYGAHLAWQIRRIGAAEETPQANARYGALFRANVLTGGLLVAGFLGAGL